MAVSVRASPRALCCLLLVASVGCRPFYHYGILPRTGPVVPWKLVRELPHDRTSFTQGLAYADGYLYESAGGELASRIIKVDATTGAIAAQRRWPIAIAGTLQAPFAEGLARDGDRLVQLSWKNGRALTWSRHDLCRGPDLAYAGEGWGLCFDGAGYWRSDGSARLRRHAAGTFIEDRARTLTVRSGREQVASLNELECIGEHVLANVWQTPYVVIIRARDGVVAGVLDFTPLVEAVDARGRESVLNGLAWDPDRRELYVTGKRWAKTYVVQLGAGW